MSTQYELIVVFDSDLDEVGVRAQIDKIVGILQTHKGRVVREELLGRQQLSYPMKKKTHGSYVILVVESETTFVADLTRQLRITDEVLRFSAVKKDKFAPDFVRRSEERVPSKKSQDGDAPAAAATTEEASSDAAGAEA